jgi:photosystem II stability/assembly factor-like uncharacterized protein
MKKLLILLVVLFYMESLFSQSVKLLSEGTNTSLRGLSVVNEKIMWVSGSSGMVARSTDGGLTFKWIKVKNYEGRDFRDIEGFDSNTAIIMAVSEPALILKTYDGGLSWKQVFVDSTPGMFLDAMDFDGGKGVVVGDPIDGKVFLAETTDRGDSWQIINKSECSSMKPGEAFFASSGSNISFMNKSAKYFYVSGGMHSRIFFEDNCIALPLQMGKNSTGANAMDISPSGKKGIVVGGNFSNDKLVDSTSVQFSIGKNLLLSRPQHALHGYRSSVAYITEKDLIACGTSGVDFSSDGGLNWNLISSKSFHVAKKSKYDNAVYLAGTNGTVAKLILND